MVPVIDYMLVKHWDAKKVAEEVKHLLQVGWQPLGAPTTTVNEGTLVIVQAMVLYG